MRPDTPPRRWPRPGASRRLTAAAGAPGPDNQDCLTAGPWGPVLLQDVWFPEKAAPFDSEVVPERRPARVPRPCRDGACPCRHPVPPQPRNARDQSPLARAVFKARTRW
nr:hypothetical protein StreXyl84_71650 [Streptomyces sp. Xyl84]